MIPNIYHLYYYKKKEDIDIFTFFGIKSILEINKPEIIYFYYDYLPNGSLWDKIKNTLTLKKIVIPKKFLDNEKEYFTIYKFPLIYKELKLIGGIYFDLDFLCVNPITPLLNNSFLKTEKNEIIMCEKNNEIAIKYYDFYLYGIKLEENNIKLLNKKYYQSNNLFNEIFDFSFGDYFHLVKNSYFVHFSANENITIFEILNTITTYNLLVRNALTFNYLENKTEKTNEKLNLINNIDIIYWINLEKSIDRREKIKLLLDRLSIKNERINALDGSIENNIMNNYFYAENNIYPNFNNKEYAILSTHLNTIEKYVILKENVNFGVAMICEDDVTFDFIKYWNKDLKKIIEEAPKDWEIIMLGYFSLNINRNNLYEKWNNEWSAICYLINHTSIQKIKDFKKEGKWICKETDLMVSDNYIFSKFNTYVYKYPMMTFPNNNDSTFHVDHLDYHKLYKISNYMVLENMYEEYINICQ